eukprot:g816.t1
MIVALKRAAALRPNMRNVSLRSNGLARMSSAQLSTSVRTPEGIYTSPFPDIAPPPYLPLADYVSEHWKRFGDKTACLDGVTGESRSFAELEKYAGAVTANLSDMGIGRGDVVGIYSPNHVDFILATLATSRLGAALTMVNPLYTEHELASQLEGSNAKVLFAHTSSVDIATKAIDRVGRDSGGRQKVENLVIIGDEGSVPEGATSMESLKRDVAKPILRTVDGVRGSDLVALPYSSGTTGLPKGTMLTHDNIVVNMMQTSVAEHDKFSSEDTLISPLPMFHIYAFTVLMLQSARTGHTFITMARFDLERFCQLVQDHRCTRAYLVPPIILGLAKHPVVEQYDMSSLKSMMSAAAPLGSDVETACAARLGCTIKQGWGMSELSPLGTLVPDDGLKPGSGSIGPCVSSTEAKIIDVDSGEPVEEGKTGELCIRGPQVMQGYLNAPDKTAECLDSEGWLRTGDIARADEDGYFYIVDRLKELIKYKGFQVAPAELEDVLTSHEMINDAVVIPVLDDDAGEIPRAYVVPRDPNAIDVESLSAWVSERVAPHKKLRGGIVFVDAIPKTASGKILRREVVAMDRAS